MPPTASSALVSYRLVAAIVVIGCAATRPRATPILAVISTVVSREVIIGREFEDFLGAGYRIRTGDLQLGKLTLYR